MPFKNNSILVIGIAAVGLLMQGAPFRAAEAMATPGELSAVHTIAARTCRQTSSCREAVELWCSGYRRADGDSDGIPCENVCHSREEVDEIRARLGC